MALNLTYEELKKLSLEDFNNKRDKSIQEILL